MHQIYRVSTGRKFAEFNTIDYIMHSADNGCIYITRIKVGPVLIVNSKDFYYKRKEDD